MTKEQTEMFSTIQEILRGVVMAIAETDPAKSAEISTALAAFARQPGLSPLASRLLQDLAEESEAGCAFGAPTSIAHSEATNHARVLA